MWMKKKRMGKGRKKVERKVRKEKVSDKIKSKVYISLILTIIFIAFIFIIIFFVITSFPNGEEIVECEKNYDCVKIQTTCCSCEMGGIEKCVPRGQEKIYEAKDCPEQPVCMALYNCEVKGCICSEGECTEIIGEKIKINE
jgi:hypothetical protein